MRDVSLAATIADKTKNPGCDTQLEKDQLRGMLLMKRSVWQKIACRGAQDADSSFSFL